jgi:flagellar motor switch protein FliN/FliY
MILAGTAPTAIVEAVRTAAPVIAQSAGIGLLNDVPLVVTAELGRTSMYVRDLLNLAPGTVVELDRLAGAPIDILVNGKIIARGEVVVVDEEFGVRVVEIVDADAN